VDDVNIHIEEIVLDGPHPLSPEHLQTELSRQADGAGIQQLPAVTRAVGESIRTRLADEFR
jgi:hypothetical protein